MITPSFNLTATERALPKLALDFTTGLLDNRITFTRTTGASNPATYVASNGYITSATNNEPRFDYNPINLTCKGLLIEESRTNHAPVSNEFTNAWWNASTNASASGSAGTSPDGTNNSYKITASASGGYLGKSALTFSATGSWTLSFYAKKDVIDTFRFRLRDSTAATDLASIQFNLTSGVVSTVVAGSGTCEPAGAGFFRCTITGTVATAGNSHTIYIYPRNTTGAVNGDSILAFGFQIEQAAFATSYIPTTTTALTRNADFASMTGTNFSDWYNATEGAFVTQQSLIGAVPSDNQGAIAISSGALTTNAMNLYASFNGIRYTRVLGYNSSGINDLSLYPPAPQIALNTVFTTAVAYKLNDYAFSVLGNAVVTDTTADVPTVNQLRLGAGGDGSKRLFGHLRKVFYYPQRLTNAEIQAFSK